MLQGRWLASPWSDQYTAGYPFQAWSGVSWGGAVVSGLAYELSGLIASYPSPGHDGKLFASTMLPLACLALVLALQERRWTGYPLLAAAVALSLLGHFQLAYYLLIAAG